MLFFCVTPCLNAEKYIEETIRSVVNQTVFNLPENQLIYRVQDGGSTDKTISIVERIITQFPQLDIQLNSQSDQGMYDAISNGFLAGPKADIYAYINAGDYYSLHAFEIVAEVFSTPSVHFVTGLNMAYNEKGHLIEAKLPEEYRPSLLVRGLYGRVLPFIQQESTFWDLELHQHIDFDQLRQRRYAGDFYLWRTFIEITPLYIISAWLGGFRVHEGQLSERFMTQYLQEMSELSLNAGWWAYLLAYFDKLFQYLPGRFKRLFKRQTFEYNHQQQKYLLIGQ